ncbi:CRISPR-associated protein Cas5 [Synechocystis sp. PCC 7339]|uniref:CRISPR-associated protein Cas5 n=1 Tax=Synechocystis sp. PCC 7339 TaxID=2782213 RepID=UPI001CBF8583|nr:CRISPR-associated protein Cas5 [Synechocystis sp. PCC 7339]UAJ72460.1 CRISPR-associated protein Cas5 [Synechocystis sp. PCC 7339]
MINLFYLDCPCTSFPRSFARDYKETYLYPPPSTVYGFLLSLVGEENLTAHLGVKIAIGLIGDPPPISRIVRKQRHHKFSKQRLGSYPSSKFSKPNHQELLTDLKVALKVDSSGEKSKITLADRVAIAVSTPEEITRFGGLSLGESWAMVNGIRPYRPEDGDIRWLMKDNRGLIGLPVWIDRKTTQGTFQRFTLEKMQEFRDAAWITIKANH